MEESIKSIRALGVSFLLRSLFAGAFFPISYYVFSHPAPPYRYFGYDSEDILYFGLPIALISGISAYALHRSVLYPCLEFLLDHRWLGNLRRRCCCFKKREHCYCCSLISQATIERLRRTWGSLENSEIELKLTTWGDYAHHHYCSAICILLGALIARYVAEDPHLRWLPLTFGTLIFFAAGLISDWRLRTVREALRRQPHTTAAI